MRVSKYVDVKIRRDIGKPPHAIPLLPSAAAEQFLERSSLTHLEPVLLRLGVTSPADIAGFLDDATLVRAGVNKQIERRKLLTLARA